jgi:2,3-dihydroxyphenylpropionate 1,2-dioxygenase
MDLVGAYACSHAALLITRGEKADPALKKAVYDGFAEMGRRIRAARPDALVVVATDHSRIHPLSLIPQFTIGVSAYAQSIGDAGLARREFPIHQALAREILEGCLDGGLDLAYSEQMAIDHSFVTPLQLAGLEGEVPVVPITQNCNNPPLPRLERSHAAGRILAKAIAGASAGRAVLIGTGGLSHWVGSPEWQAFMREPAGTRIDRQKDFKMSLPDTGEIDESFDRAFLERLAAGQAGQFLREFDTDRLYRDAGNGAQEIRNWLLVAGAMHDSAGSTLAYAPVPEWCTGTAVMAFSASPAGRP